MRGKRKRIVAERMLGCLRVQLYTSRDADKIHRNRSGEFIFKSSIFSKKQKRERLCLVGFLKNFMRTYVLTVYFYKATSIN